MRPSFNDPSFLIEVPSSSSRHGLEAGERNTVDHWLCRLMLSVCYFSQRWNLSVVVGRVDHRTHFEGIVWCHFSDELETESAEN